jgi:proton translocating ATP synthase F1 alpha subunit
MDIGVVINVGDGVASIYGLSGAKSGELVTFPRTGIKGLVLSLLKNSVKVAVLGNDFSLYQGDKVVCGLEVVKVPVGFGLLGTIVDSLCNRVDGSSAFDIKPTRSRPVEVIAPGIIERERVAESFETGILAVDSMLPIGRGQRELVIGDRQTGKTTIAIDAIIHQRSLDNPVFCIYVAIGQKKSTVNHLVQELIKQGAFFFTNVVCASASESASMQFLAPYTGCTVGEFFRDLGYSSFIVYDDLTKQAVAYRQMSLLLRRPPCREAFPGDVFYLHSRLLERAAKLHTFLGGGSLTAFPIVQTEAGDVSAYIPTNVISITDGQIFLDSKTGNKGFRPAINFELSVSRVGSVAQCVAMREISRSLKFDLAQFKEVEFFLTASNADIEPATRAILVRGSRLLEIIRQWRYSPLSIEMQIVLIFAGTTGELDSVSIADSRSIKDILVRVGASFDGLVFSKSNVKDSSTFIKDFITLIKFLWSARVAKQ